MRKNNIRCDMIMVDEALRNEILKKIPEEKLNALMSKKIKQFNGLITRDICLKLIAKDLGITKKEEERIYKINKIPSNGRGISLTARIDKIMPKIVYPSGKKSRSIILSDGTGYIALKLWGDQLKIFDKLKIGDIINVSSAYARNRELGLGYRGELNIVTHAPFTDLDELPEREYINVRGFIKQKIGYGYYEPERKAKRYFDFIIQSEDGKTAKCRMEFGPSRGDKLNIGDEIILEHAYTKNGVIKIYSTTRMRKKSTLGLIDGFVKNIYVKKENDKEYVDIEIDEFDQKEDKRANKIYTIELPKDDFIKFMHIHVNEDITLDTILNLKKSSIIGKIFTFKKEYIKQNN